MATARAREPADRKPRASGERELDNSIETETGIRGRTEKRIDSETGSKVGSKSKPDSEFKVQPRTESRVRQICIEIRTGIRFDNETAIGVTIKS
ncbi:hypothetical protein EVAR_60028_1 [Eumeta japonica]|uniref:Uncharacterized protein n=1 Tax=Eumeta variegata TaxID=151549 RepID=A0A4C1ZLE2_EUMVA|nr:hypothetical protein EVAR_60028_1 [Eumeta japonica]